VSGELNNELIVRAIKLLQQLIQTDTTNENGNEIEAANVLIDFFNEHGIESRVIYSPGGRANLIATLEGATEEEPIILLSHLDVVGPGESEWTYPPFSGAIEQGVLWGRGTLDTKQLTAMHAAVFAALKKMEEAGRMQRRVTFLATADEENGSQEGMAFLAERYSEQFIGATVFSEGGGFLVKDDSTRYMYVASGEKGTAKVRLKTKGEGGHAGAPPADQALLFLVSGLTSLLQENFNPPSYPILDRYTEAFQRTLDKEEKATEDEIFIAQMHDYMRYPTVTVEKVNVGQQINVVPYYAEATVEIRTLPMQRKEDIEQILNQLFHQSNIDWEITSFQEGYECDISTEAMVYVEKLSENAGFPIVIMPFTALGKTDGRFIGHLSKNIFGLSPVKIPFTEVLKRVHNTDERIELDSFEFGIRLLVETITFLAGREVYSYADTERES
jgi:acetylornithine deacetylase/succinyl-diaminopimelate desuccinylase-like protein